MDGVVAARGWRCTGLALHGHRGRQAGAAQAAEQPQLGAF